MTSLKIIAIAGLGLLTAVAATPLTAQTEAEAEQAPAQADGPAEGQASVPADLPAPICHVEAIEIAADAPMQLQAACGTHGLLLGPVSTFSVSANGDLNAMLVDVTYQGKRRLLMLSLGDDGFPTLQNVTGQIARLAGKGPMSGIDDIDVDLTNFASAGTVMVNRVTAEGQAEAATSEIDLGEQITAEQARQAAQ